MSTSPHEGVYLYDPTEFGADRFVDTALTRDGVVNSALHKADSAAQPRATWAAPVTALWTDEGNPFLTSSSEGSDPTVLTVDTWYLLPFRAVYCPKINADGQAYRLRIGLGARSSAGHDCDFAVMVAPQGSAVFSLFGTLGNWPTKVYSDVTSTTVAMLTADDATRWMDPTQALTDQALSRETWSTLTDIGGSSIAVRAPMLEVFVLAKTANVSSTPEVHLFTAAEVIGT